MIRQLFCHGTIPLTLIFLATGWQIESMAAEEDAIVTTTHDQRFAYRVRLWSRPLDCGTIGWTSEEAHQHGGCRKQSTFLARWRFHRVYFQSIGYGCCLRRSRRGRESEAAHLVSCRCGGPRLVAGRHTDPLFFRTGHRPRGLRTSLDRFAGRGPIPALAGTLRQRWRVLTERPAARHRFGGPLGCRMATLPWWAKQTPADSRPRHARGDSVASSKHGGPASDVVGREDSTFFPIAIGS